MSSIAVVGPGAIGGTLAGWLAQLPRHHGLPDEVLSRLRASPPDQVNSMLGKEHGIPTPRNEMAVALSSL